MSSPAEARAAVDAEGAVIVRGIESEEAAIAYGRSVLGEAGVRVSRQIEATQEKGAELLVSVGSHFNLVEFLDKNRRGMASTFLTRLRVGEILVDAKGVSRLYKPRPGVAPIKW